MLDPVVLFCLLCSMSHLQQLLTRLVGGAVKLYTTSCVSKELTSLGSDFAASAAFARQQQLHKCEHNPAVAAADCLLAAVAGANSNHWWIATQDQALQTELGTQQAVPMLFASVNGLHLAEPAEQAKAAIAAGHMAAQTLQQHELKSEALQDLSELRPKDDSWKKFKRKKVKGPNPLSIRKKQQRPGSHQQSTAAAARTAAPAQLDGKQAAKQRKRKKKQVDGPGGTAAGATAAAAISS
eukprot:GHRR01025263.1.p1 GENE.GHRR01025263.1~~GHRR01025263.1.p1  ORF type:complete len:239 (+),score=112.09 GHRR01025263.1:609-1325(+)